MGDDVRHHICNVCTKEFTCPPSLRQELMESFTGPELAALIDQHCIIGSEGSFSDELQLRVYGMSATERLISNYEHWIKGVYLITQVEESAARRDPICIDLETSADLENMKNFLGSSLSMRGQGQTFHLVAEASLVDADPDDLPAALAALQAPATLALRPDPDCSEDHIIAVNLARPLNMASLESNFRRAEANARMECPEASLVEIIHYIGGPCEDNSITCCLVLGGSCPGWSQTGRGWTRVASLTRALRLAARRAQRDCESQGDLVDGQTVRIRGLQECPELNGKVGLTVGFSQDTCLWAVKLKDESIHTLGSAHLEGLEGGHGRVLTFWGDARWSRAQLLGEIARGHWGLCRAGIADLVAASDERWTGLQGRLAFAPVTDMTEDFLRDAQRQMASLRANVVATIG